MKTFGIDVSRWQGNFNFAQAIKEGVQFAIIKAGGADGGLYADPMFETNYKNAKANGMNIGAYWYSDALTTEQAKKEAKFLIDLLKNKRFEYPIYFDVEQSEMRSLGKNKLSEIVKTFCNELENAGYWAGFYTNYDWYINYLNGASLAKRYTLWLAAWRENCPLNDAPMWQFGGEKNLIRSNKIAGVVCDQNYCYKDFPTLIKSRKLNGYNKTDAEIAIEKLYAAGIIVDKTYWSEHYKDLKHLDELLIKFAAKI